MERYLHVSNYSNLVPIETIAVIAAIAAIAAIAVNLIICFLTRKKSRNCSSDILSWDDHEKSIALAKSFPDIGCPMNS